MKRIKKLTFLILTLCAFISLLSLSANASDNGFTIDPELVFNPQTTLSVFVDGAADHSLSGEYSYGEAVELNAPHVAGKNFLYWINSDGDIISYNSALNLKMYADTALGAVYGTSAVTAQTTAAFLNVSRTDGEIIFNAIASANDSITETGIRYSTTKSTLDELKGTDGVTVENAYDSTANWTLIVTPADEDTTYYAVVYTTVGSKTTYSEVKAVKLSELQSGVSTIIDLGELNDVNIDFCNVTFDANGGTGIMGPQGMVKGTETALNANTFVRRHYRFSGWNTAADGSGTDYTDCQSVTLNGNITLYAQWTENTQTITAENVTVTFGDTGKRVSASVTVPATSGGAISYAVKSGSEDYIEIATGGKLTIKKVPTDGKAYVVVTAAETDTYARTTKVVTVTINKAIAVPATVAANNRTYDKTEKPLVTVTGTASGGTMRYALGTEAEATESYTTSIPEKTDVGTYYVWYMVEGDDNHNSTEPAVVEVEIKSVDKTELNKAINAAKDDYDRIKDNEEYRDIAELLEEAINDVKGVAEDDYADASAVSNAVTQINQKKASAEEALADRFAEHLSHIDDINTENKDHVESILDLYNKLTLAEKAAVDRKIGREGTKKIADLEKAMAVTDRISALRDVDDIDINDENAITFARTAYELLSESQKQMISEDIVAKLTAAEAKLAETKDAAALAAAKAAAIERLDDYADAKAKSDATEAEKKAYDDIVAAEKEKIDAAADEEKVAEALTEAKKAVDGALAKIESDRAEAAAKAEEMAAADKAVADAKTSTSAALTAAEAAAADEYASADDKNAIDVKKAAVENAVKAADELPNDATAEQKKEAAKAIEDAVKDLETAIDTANVHSAVAKAAAEETANAAAQLAAAKTSAIERLDDYSEAKAKADATEAEKKAYDDTVAAEKEKINAAADKEKVAEALTAAKKAVDDALAKIESDRAEATAKAEEMATADKAVADAKTSTSAALTAAEAAAADEYASADDKNAIDAKKAAVENAVKAANELSQDATAKQKNDAAKAIEDAVKELETAIDTANVHSAAARAAAEEAEDAAKQLAEAKTSAIERLDDYSGEKAKADATEAEKKAYDDAVAAEKEKINAATDKEKVAEALTAAKKAVNDALAKIENDRKEAATKEEEMTAADKAVTDAETSAEAAKTAAETAAADEYASDDDKSAVAAAKKAVEDAVEAANELPENATAAQKNAAAKAIEDAVKTLESVVDTANANSAAKKAAKEAEDAKKTSEEEALASAKASALQRLNDVYSAKNLSDYRKAQKKELAKARKAGRKAIKAATTPKAAENALANAKKAINAVKTKNQQAEEAFAAAKAKAKAVKANIVKAKAKKNKKATVTWKKASDISGYQVAYGTSKKFSDKTTKKEDVSAKAAKKTLKKLKAGKKYYVKVRTYKVIFNPAKSANETVYGKWSKVKSFKAK